MINIRFRFVSFESIFCIFFCHFVYIRICILKQISPILLFFQKYFALKISGIKINIQKQDHNKQNNKRCMAIKNQLARFYCVCVFFARSVAAYLLWYFCSLLATRNTHRSILSVRIVTNNVSHFNFYLTVGRLNIKIYISLINNGNYHFCLIF